MLPVARTDVLSYVKDNLIVLLVLLSQKDYEMDGKMKREKSARTAVTKNVLTKFFLHHAETLKRKTSLQLRP